MCTTDFLSANMFVTGKQMEDGGNQPPSRRFKACPVNAAGAMEAERGGGGRVGGLRARTVDVDGAAGLRSNPPTM